MTPWTAAYKASPSLTISQSLLKLMYTESVMASNHLILYCPLLLLCQFSPASESFLMSWLFASGSQSIGASVLALPMNTQGWFPLGWLIWSVCYPRVSWESSPEPEFESISSSALSLFYGPALTSVHDYWKNHSFGYTDLQIPFVWSMTFHTLQVFVIPLLCTFWKFIVSP